MKFLSLLRKALATTLFVLAASAAVFAQQGRVVASTSWTAALARAAGAAEIVTIAPLELRHPPEYEIKPSDLQALRGASLVVYGGYERFAKRLAEAAGGDGVRTLEVYTDNIPSVIKSESRKIAEALGTLSVWEAWARSFDELTESLRRQVLAAYPNRRAVVQRYQKTAAEWMGFEVAGTFGPGESSPAAVLDLVKLVPDLVIDNYHNPTGKPVAEARKVPYVELINFPGRAGTLTLEDVYRYNAKAYLDAAIRR